MSFQICVKCVLDTTDSYIRFDQTGVCNYCREYEEKEKRILKFKSNSDAFTTIITEIKHQNKNEQYDCLIGLSGGLDSSYLLYLTKIAGLRPLAVHYDCGWNTEKATGNIDSIVTKLDIDLETYVVNWEEFRDVQIAYLKSGVIDLEVPTDHSFLAALYKTAEKYRIKHILTGHNFVTEAIMPKSWIYDKGDATNLMDIHRRYGKLKKLTSFPIVDLKLKFYYYNMLKIKNIHLLNYLDYQKPQAFEVLEREIGWKKHPVKHGESVWTRFYQCYILPTRFGVDKRKAHLSNLICSQQISRANALNDLATPIYEPELLQSDKQFVLKKFEINEVELEYLMKIPINKHHDFKTDKNIKNLYNSIFQKFNSNHNVRVSTHY